MTASFPAVRRHPAEPCHYPVVQRLCPAGSQISDCLSAVRQTDSLPPPPPVPAKQMYAAGGQILGPCPRAGGRAVTAVRGRAVVAMPPCEIRSLLAGLWIPTACKQSKNQGRLQRIKRWLTSAGNQRWFYRARSSRPCCGPRIQYPLVYLPSTPSLAPP
jgi:hypothetical protein